MTVAVATMIVAATFVATAAVVVGKFVILVAVVVLSQFLKPVAGLFVAGIPQSAVETKDNDIDYMVFDSLTVVTVHDSESVLVADVRLIDSGFTVDGFLPLEVRAFQ